MPQRESKVIGITGGTGFIGQRLVPRLAQESAVRVLTTKTGMVPLKDAEYVVGEVTSREVADKLIQGCTTIIHLAGVAHSSLRTEAEKQHSYNVNVEGTRNVLNAAMHGGVQRFV